MSNTHLGTDVDAATTNDVRNYYGLGWVMGKERNSAISHKVAGGQHLLITTEKGLVTRDGQFRGAVLGKMLSECESW